MPSEQKDGVSAQLLCIAHRTICNHLRQLLIGVIEV